MSRPLLHHGVVAAAGIWIQTRLIGTHAGRERVISAWESGCIVYPMEDGWVVQWPLARPMSCESATGLPLTRHGRVLSATPADEGALARATGEAPSSNGLLLLAPSAGRLRVTPLRGPGVRVDAWLDLSAWCLLAARGLGASPASVPLIDDPTDEGGAVGEGVPLMSYRGEASAHPSATRGGGAWSALARWTKLGIAALLSRRTRSVRADPSEPEATQQPARRPARRWIRQLMERAATRIGLATYFGRRQRRYVARVLDMFERGDIEGALRHAIPLRGAGASDELPPPTLGLPEARQELRVTAHDGSSPLAMSVTKASPRLEAHYRQAVRQLIFAGRYREAAFTLAELLDDGAAAVQLLEERGELTLAAEIAEAKALDPGVVVRQWFIAGAKERAVRVARRTGAFADAVVRLERDQAAGGREAAADLRQRWASTLAAAGSYAAAVEVIWPLEGLRETATRWMDAAVQLGGPAAARMLAKRILLQPQRFGEVRSASRDILTARGRQAQWVRGAFADGLLEAGVSAETRALARPVLRALVADAGRGARSFARVQRLLDLVEDKAMRTDLPSLRGAGQTSTRLRVPDRISTITFSQSDTGTTAVHDAAFLPNGGLVLALGEVGTRLLDVNGRLVTHFDEPAHRLVVADSGDRAITLARRGQHWRLAQVSLSGDDAQPVRWAGLTIALSAWADSFDGSIWFVGQHDALVAVDALARDRVEALWRVGRLGGPIRAVARDSTAVTCLVSETEARELVHWGYTLPDLRLDLRQPVPFAGDLGETPLIPLAVGAGGFSAALNRRHWGAVGGGAGSEGEALWLQVAGAGGTLFELVIPGDVDETLGTGSMNRDWLVLPRSRVDKRTNSTDTWIDVLSLVDAEVQVRVALPGAWGGARLLNHQLTVFDNKGRVALVDLDLGDRVRHHRTQAGPW